MSGPEHNLVLVPPRVAPPLDPLFRPAVLCHRRFRLEVEQSGDSPTVRLALARGEGGVSCYETAIYAEHHPEARANGRYLERLLKFLLWSRGAGRVYYEGPERWAVYLQKHYQGSPTGRFDASLMGEKIYEQPFQIEPVASLPAERESSAPLGRHLEGCRIGFDLGASDRKVAAVRDGQTVFSEEVPWDPRPRPDPQWHFDQIMAGLRSAAAHLPKVDAIGGSSAGVLVNNQIKVASLFRAVPEPLFRSRVKNLFLELKRAWGGIPFEVVNDGEVTALAGAMGLQENAVLGLALGSSQAAGYVTPEGHITSWLNELAFAPIDYHPQAAVDEWSGDAGCGVQYLSQQAVGRLIAPAGLEISPELPLPERLVQVQQRMAAGDERAARIYETIGVYLGYAVGHYADFYSFRHVLLLGRVTSGTGGERILQWARRVVSEEFPELTVSLHLPDEKEKRHGQAMAAASLPVLS